MLMPVAHALLQVREDLDRLAPRVRTGTLWSRPGGAASVGFHVRHLGGSIDRLLTYARGEALTDTQRAFLATEGEPDPGVSIGDLVVDVQATIDAALRQVRGTSREELLAARGVGRMQLPSTVLGLLFHAAEHASRHMGQAFTTARILTD